MKQFNAFLHKEFLHILRDKRTMLILLLLPVVMVLLFGFAITTEVKNTRISVYDPLHSANTERIKQMLANNPYFILQPEMTSPKEAECLFQQGVFAVFPQSVHATIGGYDAAYGDARIPVGCKSGS